MSLFVQQHATPSAFTSAPWVILTPIEQRIKEKIEAVGTPLKDWDIQINYGIKTGYNEAFIISTEKRDEILANCQTEDERRRTEALIRPIEEQNRIAEVLSHFDEHIDNLVALLEKRKQVKAATMHALLSGSTRLPGFTALWQETTLEKLCLSMNSGGTPDSKNPNFYNGDIPFLSIADMTLQGKYVSKTTKTITKEGLDNSSARLVRRGILLYAMYASLGKCSLSSIDLSISQAILAIETNPKLLETDYLYYFLTYIEKKVKTLGQTGTQTNLSKQLVKEICVTAPTSVKEQEAIADILSNMDRGIEALEEQVEKYRQMKEGAMEELLTGKVRLV